MHGARRVSPIGIRFTTTRASCHHPDRPSSEKVPCMSAALKLPPTFADPVAEARALAPLLADEAPKIEALGQLTPTVVDALHARGLYRALLPRALNGYGVGIDTFVRI